LRKNNNNLNSSHNKGSLLTYNFNKDAYSNAQRILINISNSNLFSENKDIKKDNNNKYIFGLKRQKTAINNYKSMVYPNINIKNNNQKNRKYEKIKKIHKNHLILGNIYNNYSKKDIKKCSSVDFHKYNVNINNNNISKINKNEQLLQIIDEPNCLLNYIYEQIKEYKKNKIMLLKNRRKCFKLKLENMKTDLKQIEQKAFYQVLNLRYERPLGNEINIKTNIFCKK
jgi:hypothetical protein